MILTNEQVALLLERKRRPDALPGPRATRPGAGPGPDRAARLARRRRRRRWPSTPVPSEAGAAAIEASRLVAAEAKRRGHGASSLSSLVLRSLKPARYSPDQRGPRRPRQRRLRPLHLADPPLPRPDRPSGLLSVVDGGEPAPTVHEVAAAAEHCSDKERDSMRIERDADDVCAAFLLQRELFERGSGHRCSRARSPASSPPVLSSSSVVEHCRRLRGLLPGPPDARRAVRDQRRRVGADRHADGRRVGIGDAIEVKVESVEAPRGRVDLIAAEERKPREKGSTGGGGARERGRNRPPRLEGAAMSDERGARARTSPPTGRPGSPTRRSRPSRSGSPCREPRSSRCGTARRGSRIPTP